MSKKKIKPESIDGPPQPGIPPPPGQSGGGGPVNATKRPKKKGKK